MIFSMYDSSIPHVKHMLSSLSAIIEKSAVYATDKKIEPSVLVSSRLYPDMFALAKQIQIATDQAKACAARLAGIEIPIFDDNETTLGDLQARIAKTIVFLDSITAEQIDGSENRDIVFSVHGTPMEFKGRDYLLEWLFPNFYFHLTTAYNILRHNGVDIGKKDFLGVDEQLRRIPIDKQVRQV